jgi:hypothetical protein
MKELIFYLESHKALMELLLCIDETLPTFYKKRKHPRKGEKKETRDKGAKSRQTKQPKRGGATRRKGNH